MPTALLNPIEGKNRYCGPAALATILGVTTDHAARVIRGGSNERWIKGVRVDHMAMAMAQLGVRAQYTRMFSQAASLASHQHAHELQIQAHLCLNNQQLALQALDALAEQALQGSSMAYFRLCAQLWETHQLGQAERFADWAQQSTHALYLQPLIQALYILAGADAKLQDLPEEVRCASDAVVVKARRQLASYPNGQRLADACLPPAA